MTDKSLGKRFFARNSTLVAHDLIGRELKRETHSTIYEALILESGAYYGFSKRPDEGLCYTPGVIHLYSTRRGKKIFCISTERAGVPSVVTIRKVLFRGRRAKKLLSPTAIVEEMEITEYLEGKNLRDEIWIEGPKVADELIKYTPYSEKMSDNCIGYYTLKL